MAEGHEPFDGTQSLSRFRPRTGALHIYVFAGGLTLRLYSVLLPPNRCASKAALPNPLSCPRQPGSNRPKRSHRSQYQQHLLANFKQPGLSQSCCLT